ncbi:hypothetical protein O0880_21260 [Janthinobacterium sp. SUN118]|uniref:hypothetical protein n=1 Tax=Janthinobacterium sp. SUN118 TaxID=3004100 RepID=UPI0025B0FB0F|nr:hypothetical protein [Janthinobacterium sp. SUN118]MDN2711957.1 hypothetical protein [Janthinobacterium sp. SUN118]
MDNNHKSNRKAGGIRLALLVMGLALGGGAWAAPGGHGGHAGHGGFHAGHGHFHGRPHVGVWLGSSWGYGYGPGWYGDPWYGYPYGYPYGRVVVVQPPPVYIEQGGVPTAQMWYYCARPQGYYPYVKNCSTAWRAVPPDSVR